MGPAGVLSKYHLCGCIVLIQQPAQDIYFMDHGIFNCHRCVVALVHCRISVCAVQHQGFPVGTVLNCSFQLTVSCIISPHKPNLHKRLPSCGFRFHDPLAGFCLRCQWFLTEYIFSCFDGCHYILLMIWVNSGDNHCINVV